MNIDDMKSIVEKTGYVTALYYKALDCGFMATITNGEE